jgi:hypothetical protein
VTRDEIREFLGLSASGRDGAVLPGHVRSLERGAAPGGMGPTEARSCHRPHLRQTLVAAVPVLRPERAIPHPQFAISESVHAHGIPGVRCDQGGRTDGRAGHVPRDSRPRQVGHKAQAVGTKSARSRYVTNV